MNEVGPAPIDASTESTETLFERTKRAVMEEAGRNFEADHERRVEELVAANGEEKGLSMAEEELQSTLAEKKGRGAVLEYKDDIKPGTSKNTW